MPALLSALSPMVMGALLLQGVCAQASAAIPESASEWFAAMALEPAPGESFEFVSGDNVRGYFHARTGTHYNVAGYRIGPHSVFHGFVSRVGNTILSRADAVQERVYPWGHEAVHQRSAQHELPALQAKEALLLHSGRQLISLRLQSDVPQILTLQPLLDESDQAVMSGESAPAHTPPAHSSPAAAKQNDTALHALENAATCELRDGILLRTANAISAPVLAMFADEHAELSCTPEIQARSHAPVQELQLHLLFAATRDDAFAQARLLRTSDRKQALWDAQITHRYQRLGKNFLWTSDVAFNRALAWATASADSFVVEEFGTGIWAGLPWFRDNWGRDTFIALPGTLLVTGRYTDAHAVLENFLRFQKQAPTGDAQLGRVPNRVAAGDNIIYNTIDGTPWLFRSALDYLRYSGDRPFIARLVPALRIWLAGVRRHGRDSYGLLTHDAADTWMDARIDNRQPWSPRGNRAVEIQALYYAALQASAEIFTLAGTQEDAQQVQAELAQLRKNFLPLFWNGRRMADRLHADGHADFSVRPNQLMLITVPFTPLLPADIEADVLRNSVQALLFEHGIASLAPEDPWFHPRHENPRVHHKDAAYHNGSIWTWNTGFTITALNRYGYTDLSYALTRSQAQQILTLGTRGTLSELLDAALDEQGRIRPSGTFAQSWSVAEFVRNAWQDYLGWHPDALNGRLRWTPAVPAAWTQLRARVALFADQQVQMDYTRQGDTARWTLQRQIDRTAQAETKNFAATPALPVDFQWLDAEGQRWQTAFELGDKHHVLEIRGTQASLDGQPLAAQRLGASQQVRIGPLQFRAPLRYRDGDAPVTRSVDALKRAILKGLIQ